MTDRECLVTGLVLSLFAHFCLLKLPGPAMPQGAVSTSVQVHLSSSAMTVEQGPGTGVAAAAGEQLARHEAADRRRAAFLRYLEDIDAAVHSHRLDGGETGLIGVVCYAVTVLADGSFTEPVLKSSSGSARLDAAARRAILTASGRVKRPAVTGTDPIPILLYVKYQYELR